MHNNKETEEAEEKKDISVMPIWDKNTFITHMTGMCAK